MMCYKRLEARSVAEGVELLVVADSAGFVRPDATDLLSNSIARWASADSGLSPAAASAAARTTWAVTVHNCAAV